MDKTFDPPNGRDHLDHLPHTGEYPENKYRQDEPVQVRIGKEDGRDLRLGQIPSGPDQSQDDQN